MFKFASIFVILLLFTELRMRCSGQHGNNEGIYTIALCRCVLSNLDRNAEFL